LPATSELRFGAGGLDVRCLPACSHQPPRRREVTFALAGREVNGTTKHSLAIGHCSEILWPDLSSTVDAPTTMKDFFMHPGNIDAFLAASRLYLSR
jgi:hypothetical protein